MEVQGQAKSATRKWVEGSPKIIRPLDVHLSSMALQIAITSRPRAGQKRRELRGACVFIEYIKLKNCALRYHVYLRRAGQASLPC